MGHTVIIAEAGVNHNGSMELAKKLVDVAKEAGTDIVKFQSFKAEKMVGKSAQKAAYQINNTGQQETQFDMLKRLELSDDQHVELFEYCNSKEIEFLSTPFDNSSIQLLKGLNIKTGKIPSGEITNLPYLKLMAINFEHLILSTGMSTMNEIGEALDILTSSGARLSNIIVLQCNTEYPTPFEDVNLNALKTIRDAFSVRVGYSDHTTGIEVPIAAVALGACVIEKHFTLDRNMRGPDHVASLEPTELMAMVQGIRNIEKALGHATKEPTASEMKNRMVARKSIVAARNIILGETFTENNITTKRPGNGISPMNWNQVIGKHAVRNFDRDELIEQ